MPGTVPPASDDDFQRYAGGCGTVEGGSRPRKIDRLGQGAEECKYRDRVDIEISDVYDRKQDI